ncbi:MAG: hypothetical protein COV70_01900 [Parcubacteria group bacterium CG11_big_fil_rev_8_21_14_0_20_39_22]|nr:MAG: hypothetical protein COV70_01900 [Parcubacteria group bacterium CG11_big_fil_rev_8_21_14_0_20_39_22]
MFYAFGYTLWVVGGIMFFMKRFFVFIVITVIVISVGIFIVAKKSPDEADGNLTTSSEGREQNAILIKDTDGDGLKDWEEELWGTDIFVKDTDGDGTSDFDEVRGGRNPTIPGPNDLLDDDIVESRVNPEIEEDLTMTDKFSRELFAEYAGAKQAGDFTYGNYYDILYKNIEETATTPPQKTYSRDDLTILITGNKAVIKDYGNKLGKIIGSPPIHRVEHELVIFNNAAATENPKILEEYNLVLENYASVRDEILSLPVPDGTADDHLILVNSLTAIIDGIAEMKMLLSDPVQAVVGLKLYISAAENLSTAQTNIRGFLLQNGIVFTQKDDGYVLMRSI